MELKGAEIMSVHDNVDQRGLQFSETDLDSIAAAFTGLGLAGRVPLKFGHNNKQPLTDGQPALGWLSRVYREGGKLLADFSDVPKIVYDAIKAGAYKFVSVELLQDVKAGTRVIPWVLDAVALLGADQPAFGNLKDLQSLTLARRVGFQQAARVSFTRAKFSTKQEGNKMDEKDIQALIDKAVGSVTTKFTADIDKIKTDGEAMLKAKDKELQEFRVNAHRKDLLAVFNTAIEAGEIEPAVRERFEKLTKMDKDDRVLEVSLDEAKAYIKDHKKPGAAGKQKMQSLASQGSDDPVTGTHAECIDQLAKRHIASCGHKPDDAAAYDAAVKHVMSANGKLAKAYFQNQNGTEEAA